MPARWLACSVFPTTPITVVSPSSPALRSLWPTAGRPGQSRSASMRLTMTLRGERGPSAAVQLRPATIGMPIASK